RSGEELDDRRAVAPRRGHRAHAVGAAGAALSGRADQPEPRRAGLPRAGRVREWLRRPGPDALDQGREVPVIPSSTVVPSFNGFGSPNATITAMTRVS